MLTKGVPVPDVACPTVQALQLSRLPSPGFIDPLIGVLIRAHACLNTIHSYLSGTTALPFPMKQAHSRLRLETVNRYRLFSSIHPPFIKVPYYGRSERHPKTNKQSDRCLMLITEVLNPQSLKLLKQKGSCCRDDYDYDGWTKSFAVKHTFGPYQARN